MISFLSSQSPETLDAKARKGRRPLIDHLVGLAARPGIIFAFEEGAWKRADRSPGKGTSIRAPRARGRENLATHHYRAIVESSDDAILSKDLDGLILSWNRGAERLFGFTSEEAVGRPVTIIIPPDRLDEEPTILEKIHRGERIEHFETVRQRKNGSLVDISLTISPIRNSRGKIVGASKIARDIT